MPEGKFTPRVERHLLQRLANDDYRESAEGLEVFGCTISHVQAGRVLEKAGEEVHSELYGPEALTTARRKAPKNPAELLVVEPDGARYRTNEADKRKKPDTSTETPADCPSEAESGAETADGEITPEEHDHGWRENKVGVVIRVVPGKTEPDGSYTKPKELVKTYVATTQDSHAFGRDLRTETERRGIKRAKQVVFLGDHGHGMPGMIKREFADVEKQVITDFFHGAERLGEVAAVVKGAGEAKQKKRFTFFLELRSCLWNGEAKGVAKRLVGFASRRAPRPERLSELDSDPDAKKLWEHAMYFEKHLQPSQRRTLLRREEHPHLVLLALPGLRCQLTALLRAHVHLEAPVFRQELFPALLNAREQPAGKLDQLQDVSTLSHGSGGFYRPAHGLQTHERCRALHLL